MTEPWRNRARRAVETRLREGLRTNGDNRPHYVVCGQDPLAYRLVTQLLTEQVRVTVIVPPRRRPEGPDIRALRGIRLLRAERLDEDTFRAAGILGASGLALLHQDDVGNIHAALTAQEVAPDVRVVMRMFSTSLGYRVKRLLNDCEVLSDAAMAAPAFVAAALGEVDPTHFRHFGRTLFVARREDVRPETMVCGLADLRDPTDPKVLPGDPSTADLLLAEANGQHAGTVRVAREIVRARRRRRPLAVLLRALRSFVTRKIGVATLAVLALVVVFGVLLSLAQPAVSPWNAFYLTLLTTIGGAEPDTGAAASVQIMQVVLTVAGLALIPLITAAVVDGIVKARLALDAGRTSEPRDDHVVVVGLGNVGTRVIRQLTDLGIEVVAIDQNPEARGATMAAQLNVPFIVGDAAREETLRLASVESAQALVVVSTDDVTNLQAALNARAVNTDLRVVLRLFDGDLAQRIQRTFGIGTSHSVSYLAAPAFAAALLNREVIATIPVERHLLLVAEAPVAAGSALAGRPVAEASRPGEVRVIALTRAGESAPTWAPPPDLQIADGDRLMAVVRRDDLARLLARTSAPPEPDPEPDSGPSAKPDPGPDPEPDSGPGSKLTAGPRPGPTPQPGPEQSSPAVPGQRQPRGEPSGS